MVKWEDGTLVSPAEVNSDGTITPAVYQGRTPLKAYNLNKMQTDILQIMQEIETPTPKTGENITLIDSKQGKFKSFKVSGNSYQETRSGKNKLNYDYLDGLSKTINGITFTVNEDGGITANGTATANATFDLVKNFNIPNGNYKLVGENENYSSTAIRCSYKQDETPKYASTIDKNIKLEGTITNFGVYIVILSGQTVNNITFYPMLLKSSETDLTFERGGASPSPEFPSRVRNCGDNVNLFYLQNENVPNQTWFSIDENQLLKIKQGAGVAPTPIPIDIDLNVGDTVTISAYCVSGKYTTGEISVGLYHNGSDKTWEGYVTLPKGISLKNKTYTTTITVTNTVDTFMPFIYGSPSIEEDIKFYFKVEKGSKASPYSSYGCGNVNLKVQNKNFLNVPQNYVLTGNEIIDLSLTAGNYIINWEDIVTQGTITNMLMMFYYEDETTYARYISPSYASKSLPLNATKNVTKVRIYSQDGYNSSQNVTTTFKNLMISKNGGDYVSHEEQTITFPLAEGQKLMLGDYLAEDGIHHKRGQYIFTGDETGNNPIKNRFNFNLDIKYTKKLFSKDGFCNNYDFYEQVSSDSEFITLVENINYAIALNFSGWNGVRIKDVRFSTLDELKTCLSEQYAKGTPLTIEYELAEEEIEPYTETQKKAYAKIKELYTYEDETNISSDDEIKPKYEVTYLRDLQKLFNAI